MKTLSLAIAFCILSLGVPAQAQEDLGTPADVLAAHNAYRASVGLPPLRWSGPLAVQAQQWADHLAETGVLQHSGSGQNLAMAEDGTQTVTQLVDLWGREQADFTDGIFPSISTTGNWMDVGHYSQMVWRATTAVGCGFAENYGREVLVCDYSPVGNVMGERAY
ncbi:hypothetical protein GCM10010909_14950 [Acidocella aquatica]|uniref:SCP domain-containing protein n=1 Tax=Acidocella aquatica TaxID=1922313 RepID=A0ABQ6A9Q6_9PROT|nr:CAP family protein [Acidocella aquatica]GLR66815.1 hypothetical protein GCM10010909_14950 [Acidocella aquatica]